MKPFVLISWLDKKDDPYIRDYKGNEVKGSKDNMPIPGPIHGVVLDVNSPFCGRFSAGFILATRSPGDSFPDDDTRKRVRQLKAMIEGSDVPFGFKMEYCDTVNPTDHTALFSFCLEVVGRVRTEFPTAHLVINTSSGTPAMHTVWVLLSETGQIEGDYTLVQGVPPSKRSKSKPSSVSEVVIGIDSAFGRYREVQVSHASVITDGAIDFSRARSPLLRKLYEDIKLFASANIPLLILGERGSGKTELAKFLRSAYHAAHSKSPSNSWPVVNCGQFKGEPTSMRSELFGHVEGAYTGAQKARDGILKEVDGDVLFLDEIADLDRTSQRLLVRAIEEKAYTPYGSEKQIKSDFRLVSATNRPLRDLQNSDLDADFFDRISTLRLIVPPLRDTPEDLDWMWDKMLSTTASRAGIARTNLTENERGLIVQRLREELLPGNYRDLMRLASHVLLFLGSGERFSSRTVAIESAFELVFDPSAISDEEPHRELCRRYIDGESMKDLLYNGVSVPESLSAYQAYLGREITAHLKKKDVKGKTGISYESANQWKKYDA